MFLNIIFIKIYKKVIIKKGEVEIMFLSLNNETNPGRAQFSNIFTTNKQDLCKKITEFKTIVTGFLEDLEAMEGNKKIKRENPFSFGGQGLQKNGILRYDESSKTFTSLSLDYNELSLQKKNDIIKSRIVIEIKRIFSGTLGTDQITTFLSNKLDCSSDSQNSISLSRLDKLFNKVIQGNFKIQKDNSAKNFHRINPAESTSSSFSASTVTSNRLIREGKMLDKQIGNQREKISELHLMPEGDEKNTELQKTESEVKATLRQLNNYTNQTMQLMDRLK